MIKNKRQVISKIAHEVKDGTQGLAKLKSSLKLAAKDGINLNSRIYRGRTLMHYAIGGHASGVITLLSRLGVNANLCDDDFNTPLHYAILKNQYYSVVELLKIPNIDINALGEFDQTPLHMAVIVGNMDIIKILIKKGADVFLVDEKNQSPLDYANDEKEEKIINYLTAIIKQRKEANDE